MQCILPGIKKCVECLIDNVKYTDSTLQPVIGLIRSNAGNMIEHFEAVYSSLIGIDDYPRSSHSASSNANVSSVDFKHGQ